MIAHSYGGVVAGQTARDLGLNADDLILVAAPGSGAHHVGQLELDGVAPERIGEHVHAIVSPEDWITDVSHPLVGLTVGHELDPAHPWFDLVGRTLVPGLFGGPWRWTHAGDGPPLVDPPVALVWPAWVVLVALLVVTVRRRASARRAWLLLFGYVALVTALFVVTRLGSTLGNLAGLVPRYLSDVVVVAALCVGVALLGLRDRDERSLGEWSLPSVLRGPRGFLAGSVAAVVLAAAIAVGNLWSFVTFDDAWQIKHGRDYLATAQAELAAAPPGTPMLEGIVPDRVVAGYFYPDNL